MSEAINGLVLKVLRFLTSLIGFALFFSVSVSVLVEG